MTTAPAPDTGVDKYTHVNGLRFHYREAGDPGGPPVLILHGIMGHTREWDHLASALTPRFRVIAVDQRGHGETEWAGAYTAAAMSGDIIAVIEGLGLARVSLVGHSLGGIAAFLCAAERPDLVERLVIIDIGPESLTSEWGVRELPLVLDALGSASYTDPREAVAEWLAANPLAREELLSHYVEHNLVPRGDGRLVWRFDAAGLRGFATEGTTAAELWNAIDRIAAPVLLLRGEYSDLLSRTAAASLVRRLARRRFLEIPGGGHDLGVEQPEAVIAATLGFLHS